MASARFLPSLSRALTAFYAHGSSEQLETYFTQNYGEGAVIITIPRYEAEAARDRSSRLVTVRSKHSEEWTSERLPPEV